MYLILRYRTKVKPTPRNPTKPGLHHSGKYVLIPEDIFTAADIAAQIDPKSHYQVDNEWRTNCDKGSINKIFAHFRSRKMHLFAKVLANSECVALNEIFKPILKHISLEMVSSCQFKWDSNFGEHSFVLKTAVYCSANIGFF